MKGICWGANKWRHAGRTSYLCMFTRKDIGKQNQGFLEITNFTPHGFILSLAYIVKFEL